jgi:RNA polymerase sigma factor (sigma-70 family)
VVDDLVTRLRRGEAWAFDRAYESFHVRIYSFLLRLSRRRDVAEDLAQEVWLKLARHAKDLREDTNLSAWLFTVARNAFLSHRRWAVLDVSRLVIADDEPEGVSPDARPDETHEARETAARLERALGRLPVASREVLLLVAVEGFEPAEAAEVLGLKQDALRQRLSRARAQLAEALAAHARPSAPRPAHVSVEEKP